MSLRPTQPAGKSAFPSSSNTISGASPGQSKAKLYLTFWINYQNPNMLWAIIIKKTIMRLNPEVMASRLYSGRI
jgi:hypothetical protein